MKQLYLLEVTQEEDPEFHEPEATLILVSIDDIFDMLINDSFDVYIDDIIKKLVDPKAKRATDIKAALQKVGYISAITAEELKALKLNKVNPRFAYGGPYGINELKQLTELDTYDIKGMLKGGNCFYQEIDMESLPVNMVEKIKKLKKDLKEAAVKKSEAKRLKLQQTEAVRVAEAKELLRKVGELK